MVCVILPYCFAEDCQVQLKDGSIKQMKDLQVGDEVLTVNKNNEVVFDVVYGFLHRETETEAKFLEIHLEDGKCLKMTSQHMLYKTSHDGFLTDVVPAYKISPGDFVFVVYEDGSMETQMVESIEESTKVGIYAPATFSGNIVVDGVLASCYAEYELIGSQRVAHTALAPLRMKSRLRMNRKKERNGVNKYCEFLADRVYPFYRTVAASS